MGDHSRVILDCGCVVVGSTRQWCPTCANPQVNVDAAPTREAAGLRSDEVRWLYEVLDQYRPDDIAIVGKGGTSMTAGEVLTALQELSRARAPEGEPDTKAGPPEISVEQAMMGLLRTANLLTQENMSQEGQRVRQNVTVLRDALIAAVPREKGPEPREDISKLMERVERRMIGEESEDAVRALHSLADLAAAVRSGAPGEDK